MTLSYYVAIGNLAGRVEDAIAGIYQTGNDNFVLVQALVDDAGVNFDVWDFALNALDAFRCCDDRQHFDFRSRKQFRFFWSFNLASFVT